MITGVQPKILLTQDENGNLKIDDEMNTQFFNADSVVAREEPKAKYKLTRLNDGLTKTGSRVDYIEWDETTREGKSSHEDAKVGRSLMLEPRMQYTWLTTAITEIVEQRDGYIKFKTQNSIYELVEII